jgi:hypothetical protein
MPVWHASIAAHRFTRGPDGWVGEMIEWERCGLKQRGELRKLVIGLIAGVGTGETRREYNGAVVHARRRLADRELALLTPAWCAIPAIGIAGSGKPW